MRKIIAFISLGLPLLLSAQYYPVTGLVADSSLAPIPEVSIHISNGSMVGRSDANGHFLFELREGQYELIFTHRDYQTVRQTIVLNKKGDTFNVIMPSLVKEIAGVNITTKWKDPGPEMMRRAIEKKPYWAERMPAHSCEVYIRAFEDYQKPKKREKAWDKKTEKDSSKKQQSDASASGMSMAEVILRRDYEPPGRIKEIRDAVSKRGETSSLFYTSTTEGEFHFYTNLVQIRSLSEMPVMSPLSNTALAAYKFSFLGSYKDELNRRILKIKVTPRLVSNSVFSGEVHLVDSLYYIYRLDLHYPSAQLNEYNDVVVSQEYHLTADTLLQLTDQRFDYYAKAGKGRYSGYTLVQYSKYEMPKTFPKGHFGVEISATDKEAYEKDTAYWNNRRKVPLNSTELKFLNHSDSVKRVHTSEAYLDSMEKVDNKFTTKKLLLTGLEYHNRKKGWDFYFQPVMFILQPWYPGGTRINMWNVAEKEFKSKRTVNFVENLSYGINNKDIRGTVAFGTLFNPFHSGYLSLSAGRDFNFVNSNAAFLDLARRANFYQNNHVNGSIRRELINGLYARIAAGFSERTDISNFTFDEIGDRIFEDNLPLNFETNRALTGSISVSYTPFQKYIREPKRKIVLGSYWPSFFVTYTRGIPGVFNSNIDYEYLEYGLEHDLPLGLLGRSELKVNSGSFLSNRVMSPIDWRYQRRGDIFLFTPPMYAFQTLDSTFPTFKRFWEMHYRHHFNGAIFNKIPLLKPLGFRESAGMNVLYAPERRNMLFYEVYGGFDKIIKVWRERFKLGIYYTIGYSNIFEKPRYGFKFNFEFYDRRSNSW